ncbi:predicted protein [Naegleria gruberi]|uniref:Predicted protein n=1 Tax=Naegleria gruberi TaxID=5762 RepID=D2VNF6_NAEGR|nr:uncharacterized protein NAEGRDRAFT_70480 [Naegleria gruberi]EFC41727.1 predicted protein [Naegleria gruberi]|eukprot:XP_002674471.1 predicted protein [Naegleria gruberi strain NEG-M]
MATNYHEDGLTTREVRSNSNSTSTGDHLHSDHQLKTPSSIISLSAVGLSIFFIIVTLALSFSLYGVFPKQCVKCERAELAIILTLSLVACASMGVCIAFALFLIWKAHSLRGVVKGTIYCLFVTSCVVSAILFAVFLIVYVVFMAIPLSSIVNKSGTLNVKSIVLETNTYLKSYPSYLTPNTKINIRRDVNGIIYVDGEKELDMIFGQGFATAQERLFQMDLIRRVSQGRLSEIADSSTLEDDKLSRFIGYARAAKKEMLLLNNQAKSALQAYTDGVNAYLQSGNAAPAEAILLGYDIEPWSIFDSLCVVKYIEFIMSVNYLDEERRYNAMTKYGVTLSRMEVLDPPVPFDAATIVTREDLGLNLTHQEELAMEWKQNRNNTGAYIPKSGSRKLGKSSSGRYSFISKTVKEMVRNTKKAIGSNNWAVNKAFTDSPTGYLANDPHLEFQAPDQFYLVQMNYRTSSDSSAPRNFSGAAFSGVPGIGIGRNEYIGWGVTLGYTDVQDLYILTPDPSNENNYLVDGVSKPFTIYSETIKISGADPVTIKVRESIFGPVLSESKTELPALRWIAQVENDTSVNNYYALILSKNWNEFRTYVNGIKSIVFNYAFMDVNGNIGYKLSGRIPMRREGHTGRYAVRGDTMTWDYDGYVPVDKAPEVYNPKRGYVSSANNRVVPPGYPYTVSADYFFDYRQQRIQELFAVLMKQNAETGSKLTMQDMINIQLDTFSVVYRDYKFMFVNMTSGMAKKGSKYSDLLTSLINWDGYMKKTSKEASLFEGFLRYFGTLASKEMEGAEAANYRLALWYYYKDAMLRNNDQACINQGYSTCTDYAIAKFVLMVDTFYNQYGEIPTWGTIHATPIYHIAGKDTPIIGCLSEIILKTEGGTETVLLNNVDENYQTNEGPVYRQILTFNNALHRDKLILPTGNDGNIFAKNYDNMGTLYANGEYLDSKYVEEADISDTFVINVSE